MAERTTAVRLHDDVEPELDGLAADGHVLGAITNGNFPFAQLDVAGRFAFIVHAEELGEMKPAAAPFHRAVELCGGDPPGGCTWATGSTPTSPAPRHAA